MKLHKPRTYLRLARWTVFGKPDPIAEPQVEKRLRKLHGKLFVDIGANIGHYTFLLAHNFEYVYAFEPYPEYSDRLRQRIIEGDQRRKIVSFDLALSNRDGETMFYTNPFAKSLGSACTILPVFEYKPDVDPKTRPPDQMFYGQKGQMVKMAQYDSIVNGTADLVKIDVEGAEFMVLEGMKASIAKQRVRRLCVELHNRDRKQELSSILSDYRQEWLDPSHLLATLS